MSCQKKTIRSVPITRQKNTNIFQLFHCQQNQSLLITLYDNQSINHYTLNNIRKKSHVKRDSGANACVISLKIKIFS
jgi:hypothetical protein